MLVMCASYASEPPSLSLIVAYETGDLAGKTGVKSEKLGAKYLGRQVGIWVYMERGSLVYVGGGGF